MDLQARVGERSAEHVLDLDPEAVARFARATRWGIGEEGAKLVATAWAPEIPPTFLTRARLGEFELFQRLGIPLERIVHGEQEYAWEQDLRRGERLRYDTRLAKVVEKRGASGALTILTLETELRRRPPAGGDDRRVASAVTTVVARAPAPMADGAPAPASAGPPAGTGSMIPGEVDFPALHAADLREYAEASGDFNAIHLDEKAARAAGLPGVIAHGMLSAAYLTEAARRWVRASERQGPVFLRRFHARFRAMVFPGTALRVQCGARTYDGGGGAPGQLKIELSLRGPSGQVATAGAVEFEERL